MCDKKDTMYRDLGPVLDSACKRRMVERPHWMCVSFVPVDIIY
jgi:hypothetical protein